MAITWDDEIAGSPPATAAPATSNIVWDDEVTKPSAPPTPTYAPIPVNEQGEEMPGYGGPAAEQAQSDLFREPIRLARDVAGMLPATLATAYTGIKETLPAFLKTAAADNVDSRYPAPLSSVKPSTIDKALQAGSRATEEALAPRLKAQSEFMPAETSLTMKGMESVYEPTISKLEEVTGDTGFVRMTGDLAMHLAVLYGGGKMTKATQRKVAERFSELPPSKLIAKADQALKPLKKKIEGNILKIARPRKGDKIATPAKRDAYVADGTKALELQFEALENGTLKFTSADGFEVNNRVPKTPGEALDANTRGLLEDGALIGEITGVEGVMDATQALKGIKEFIADPSYNISSPTQVTAAIKLVELIESHGKNLNPTQFQQLVAQFNDIKFGRKVDPLNPTGAYLASVVVRELNRYADGWYEALGDARLAPAKSRYKARRAIQDGLNHQFNSQLMKKAGVGGMWDAISVHQLLTGDLTSASAAKSVSWWKKWANSPDRAVQAAYKTVGEARKIEKGVAAIRPKKPEPGPIQGPPKPEVIPSPYPSTPGGTRIGSTSQVPVPLEPGPYPATPGGTRVGAPTTPRAPLAAQGPYPGTPGGTRVAAPTAPLQAPLAQPGPYTITPGRTRR